MSNSSRVIAFIVLVGLFISFLIGAGVAFDAGRQGLAAAFVLLSLWFLLWADGVAHPEKPNAEEAEP